MITTTWRKKEERGDKHECRDTEAAVDHGGSGFVGRRLVSLARQHYDARYTYFSGHPSQSDAGDRLDVRDREAVLALARGWSPDVIIHAAGSDTSADMDRVILQGTEHVCAAARACAARLIFLSTDVVFDGQHAPYREADPPRPLHAYGRAKAAAEEIVAALDDYVIVRTSLVYDLREVGHNFDWLLRALRQGEPVTLFTNQWRNPIWRETLCQALLELAWRAYVGVLHVAGIQPLTRAEFGLKMLDWWGITDRATLTLGAGDGHRWPADCRLDLSRATALLQTPLLGIDTVLRQAAAHTQRA